MIKVAMMSMFTQDETITHDALWTIEGLVQTKGKKYPEKEYKYAGEVVTTTPELLPAIVKFLSS